MCTNFTTRSSYKVLSKGHRTLTPLQHATSLGQRYHLWHWNKKSTKSFDAMNFRQRIGWLFLVKVMHVPNNNLKKITIVYFMKSALPWLSYFILGVICNRVITWDQYKIRSLHEITHETSTIRKMQGVCMRPGWLTEKPLVGRKRENLRLVWIWFCNYMGKMLILISQGFRLPLKMYPLPRDTVTRENETTVWYQSFNMEKYIEFSKESHEKKTILLFTVIITGT